MNRKSDSYRDPQPFDDRAHQIIAPMIDAAERSLVRHRKCDPQVANEVIATEYIRDCGTFLEHMSVYIENEGRLAADIFLWKLSKAANTSLRQRYNRNHRICAVHLHWHARYYFPTFFVSLRKVSLLLLQRLPSVNAIDRNGVLKLAAANLPNVKEDINSERRRRGATSDRLIVSDEDRGRRISNTLDAAFDEILGLYQRKYLRDDGGEGISREGT